MGSRCGMSWEVTAKVSGGCKYSTEETEAYMRAAKASAIKPTL